MWGRFPNFMSKVTESFGEIKSKFSSFRLLAGVMGDAKKSWFSANTKKVVEKSAI